MDFSLEAQEPGTEVREDQEGKPGSNGGGVSRPRAPLWTGLRHWPIKAHLLVMVVATLLPAAALIVYDVVHTANDELSRAEKENTRLATRIAESIEQYFSDTERLLSRIAKRATVQAMDGGYCDPILADDALLLDGFSNLVLRDPEGELICSFLPASLALPKAQAEPITQIAVAQKRFAVTGGLFSAMADEWVVFATYPIVSAQDNVVGVLSARVDLDRLQARVIHTVAPNKVVSVLDESGKFLMRSVERESWVGKATNSRALQSLPKGSPRIVRAKGVDGEARLYGLHRLSRPDWTVFAGMKEDEIFAPYRHHILRGLAIAAVALVLAVVIARWIGKQLTSPALRLRDTARRITDGDASARAQEEGTTEMVVVARAINQMLDAGARDQARIQESDRRMRETFDTVELIAIVVDEHGLLRYCNDYFLRLTGWKQEDVEGKNWFEVFVPTNVRDSIQQRYIAMMTSGSASRHGENEIVTRAGARRLIQWNNTLFRSVRTGEPIGMSSVGEDITERVAAAAREKRLTAFYAALSRTNAALIRMAEPASLYREITSICVAFGHAKVAYIALLAGDRLQPVAWAGPAEEFLANLNSPLSPPEARSPAAWAAIDGSTHICNDFLRDSRTAAWRELALPLGTKATASLPFRRGGKVVGVLSLHVTEQDFFDAELVALLEEMMADLSFALANYDRETSAREAALRLELAAQAGNVGFWDWNLRTGDMFFSKEWQRQLGFEPHELSSKVDDWRGRVHPDDYDRAAREIQGAIDSPHNELQIEMRLRHKDGSYRWTLARASVLLDENGKRWRMLGSQIDITDRKQAESQIAHLATHDGLTGLPNRRLIHDRIGQAIMHARRVDAFLAVLAIDVDRFQLVNDAYGHTVGDEVLVRLGQRLSSLAGESATVARHGGDQFVVLLTDASSPADVYAKAKQLLESCAQVMPLADHAQSVTCSIGVSVYPENGGNAESLLSNAEIAMNRAKRQGGNNCQFFSSEMSDGVRRRVDLENRLRQGMAQSQLYVVYQPKVDLASGSIVGVEALLRWSEPTLGNVSPADFIPLAEETGMIVPIGDWVLRTACAQNKAWRDEGLPQIVMSVNVSARQFKQQDVVAWVRTVLEETHLPPQGLELELTESVIAEDAETVISTINSLRSIGVELSIDDFGTGYSSLSYLKKFRVNTLKIDQSFIQSVLTNPDDAALTNSIISLARVLRMKSIAEGVETREQCDFLRSHGCDQIQGYLFSKPLSAPQVAEMLRNKVQLFCTPMNLT